MGRAQSDTYSSLFTKSDNVNLDETFDQKLVFVHVLTHITSLSSWKNSEEVLSSIDHSKHNTNTRSTWL